MPLAVLTRVPLGSTALYYDASAIGTLTTWRFCQLTIRSYLPSAIKSTAATPKAAALTAPAVEVPLVGYA